MFLMLIPLNQFRFRQFLNRPFRLHSNPNIPDGLLRFVCYALYFVFALSLFLACKLWPNGLHSLHVFVLAMHFSMCDFDHDSPHLMQFPFRLISFSSFCLYFTLPIGSWLIIAFPPKLVTTSDLFCAVSRCVVIFLYSSSPLQYHFIINRNCEY